MIRFQESRCHRKASCMGLGVSMTTFQSLRLSYCALAGLLADLVHAANTLRYIRSFTLGKLAFVQSTLREPTIEPQATGTRTGEWGGGVEIETTKEFAPPCTKSAKSCHQDPRLMLRWEPPKTVQLTYLKQCRRPLLVVLVGQIVPVRCHVRRAFGDCARDRRVQCFGGSCVQCSRYVSLHLL